MRIMPLLLIGCLACSNDDDRGTVNIAQDPSTALDDADDPRQVKPRAPDSGPGDVLGTDVSSGRPTRRMDGGTLDASSEDASAPDSAQPTPYSCQTANDCTIRNVGSCCGYFPRCANANATFTLPNCSGGVVSNCGFPQIDSCACELGQCVSLSAGVRISYP